MVALWVVLKADYLALTMAESTDKQKVGLKAAL